MRTRQLLAIVAIAVISVTTASAAKITFGPQHEMYVDGKLLLPVHAWATATKDLDRLAAMGVNVAYLSGDGSIAWKDLSAESLAALHTFLDECQKRNMYGVLNVEAWFRKPERRGILADGTLADFMNKFTDHPALMGWHITTEEDMGVARAPQRLDSTIADLAERYRQVKKIDPDHPVLVMYSGGQMLAANRGFTWTKPTPEQYYFETAKAADILYHDLFPVANNMAHDVKQIADATDLLVKYSRGRKHLWVAVDAGDRKRWTTKSHAPTGREIRNELWQAVIHGAHGLGFDYTSWKPTWASIRMSKEGEKGLTAAVTEIQALKEVILLGQRDPQVKATSVGEGNVHVAARRHGGRLYVFAVNVEPKPCRATITVASPPSANATVTGEDRTIGLEGQTIADDFKPLGVHLYVIAGE